MSAEEIDESDRDPRRIRQENPTGCYQDCIHLSHPVVDRPVRYPLDRFERALDGGDEVQIRNGSEFSRREGNEGTVRPESYNSQLLRMTDRSDRFNKHAASFKNAFKGYGWNRKRNDRLREKSHQERSNNNPFSKPNPKFSQNLSQNWFGSRSTWVPTPKKNLRNTLLRHPLEWTPSRPLDDALELKQISNPVLRDGETLDKLTDINRTRTIRGDSLNVRFERNRSRWSPRIFKNQAVYPELWYARHCAEADKKSFKVKFNSRHPNPQLRMKSAFISRSIRPQLSVTGWRRKSQEWVYFQFCSYK